MVAMMALNLKPESRVVTTPLTHVSTSNAILNAGEIPLFADVESSTLCLDPVNSVRAAETGRDRRGEGSSPFTALVRELRG